MTMRWSFGVAFASVLGSGAAWAIDYDLTARAYVKVMPDGRNVTMWGYFPTAGGDVSPLLSVPAGDTTLTVNLTNALAVPTSVMVLGATGASNPVWVDAAGSVVATGARPNGDVTSRVRSLVPETSPGATSAYSFSVRPGTYLYQSGTHAAVQAQMGLHGAAVAYAVTGEPYPGLAVENEAVLLFSDVDPALHDAVANGTYGTAAYPTAVDYLPRYFLINGESAPLAQAHLAAPLLEDQRVLLRFLNAGLETRAPQVVSGHLGLVAADAYPRATEWRTVLPLNAGRTIDAVYRPDRAGGYAIFDRRLGLSNGGAGTTGGGARITLDVAAVAGRPVGAPDAYSFAEDGFFAAAAVNGVLTNDTGAGLTAQLVSTTSHGSLALAADGSFTYQPVLDFNGVDSFTYRAVSGGQSSDATLVTLTVTPANDAPVAANGAGTTFTGTLLSVAAPGVLTGASDPDADPLTATLVTQAAHGVVTLSANGAYTYQPAAGYSGPDAFTFRAFDGVAQSNVGTISLTVVARPNRSPVAKDDSAKTRRNVAVVVAVLANDVDVDGFLNPASVQVVTRPARGVIVVNANGTITYAPGLNYVGSDAFTYTVRDMAGAISNKAKVRVNVTK